MKAEMEVPRLRKIRAHYTRGQFIAVVGFAVLAVASACNAPVGKNHYILAERLFSDHKYDAAVEEFKKIVDSDPKGALAQQALFRIGVIQYLYRDDYHDSIKSFRQFAAISPNHEIVYQAEKSIAEIYFTKVEDYRQAIEEYKRLLEKYPDSPERDEFMFKMGKAYYLALDFPKAIEVYRDILKKFPKSPLQSEVLYQIGTTFYTKGDVDLAIDAFKQVIAAFPSSQQAVFAQFGIGNCFEEKDRFDEALAIYTKILDKHPARQVVEAKIQRLKQRINRSH